jgi:hypothetical protein
VRIASAGGVLGIEQLTPGATIGIGENAVGTLNWDGSEIAQGRVSGFSSVRVGNMFSGAIDVRPPSFPRRWYCRSGPTMRRASKPPSWRPPMPKPSSLRVIMISAAARWPCAARSLNC